MNINIEKIVTEKISQMEESGVVKKTLEEKIEKAILSGVSEALDGYDLKRELSGMVSQQVMRIAKDIGFTAYNSFITEKFKEIAESYVRQDVAEKIQKTFDSLLLKKRESIKLSEIFEAYRKYVCETVDTSDKYDYEHFYVRFQKHDVYGWYDVQFAEKTPEDKYSSRDIIKFTLHFTSKDGTGFIGNSFINGENVKQKFKFGYLSDFEILILNLTFNATPIIIDIEHEDDIDTSYDIDI